MARGNAIIIASEPTGYFEELFMKSGQTIYPGMAVQIDYTVAMVGGRHTAKIYDRAADGDRPIGGYFIVTSHLQSMMGAPMTDRIPDGEKALCYIPKAGEEINLLIANLAGTADDHAIGEVLMVDDGTGKFIVTTGSPQTNPATLQEAITDPTADQLAWCRWTGY